MAEIPATMIARSIPISPRVAQVASNLPMAPAVTMA